MRYIMYGNGGSGNHGCEAIIRGTQAVLEGKYIIQSNSVEEDLQYGIEGNIYPEKQGRISKYKFLSAYLKLKMFHNYIDLDGIHYLPAIQKQKGQADLALSVGGDNYCYDGAELYAYLNKAYHKNGFKTVLWGCSIDPDTVAKEVIKKDLQHYDAIIARESITYEAVKRIQPNTLLAPDPGFFMEAESCDLPMCFRKKVIGINASPMIISYEKSQGAAYENYKNLVQYILDNTDYSIALVPHVVWKTNDDRTVLRKLYSDFNYDERISLVEDHNAPQLKYIISNCECFVGARTHATIAAYSSCVPTLVVGYSVKAKGIAKDLFGTEENYVLPVQSLNNEKQLTESFKWLLRNKDDISEHLRDYLPLYKNQMKTAVDVVTRLGNN